MWSALSWRTNSSNYENDFHAWFGGTEVYSIVDADEFGYTLLSFTVTATSSSTTLAFDGREVPAWFDLDNVSVTAIPEATTWTMMLVGFAGLCFCGLSDVAQGRLDRRLTVWFVLIRQGRMVFMLRRLRSATRTAAAQMSPFRSRGKIASQSSQSIPGRGKGQTLLLPTAEALAAEC